MLQLLREQRGSRPTKEGVIRGGPGYDKAYVDKVDKVKGVEKEVVPGGGGTNPPGGGGNENPPVNKPPVAKNDSYSVTEDKTLTIKAPGVLANDEDVDGDSLTAVQVSGTADGDLTLNANGSFTYANYGACCDPDRFTYKATDVDGDSNVATVNITIKDNNPDTDNDGVIDNDDQCVKSPGPASNNGCPVVE